MFHFSKNRGAGQRPEGFTLIEIMVAVAVASILLTALYATFFNVVNASGTADHKLDRYIEAGRALDRLRRDVQSSYFKTGNTKSRFLGEKRGLGTQLSFASLTYPRTRKGASTSDLTGVSYIAEESADGISLFREVWNPYIDDRIGVELLAGLEEFEVSYFNGKHWSGAWDSELEKALPRAIKVALTLDDGRKLSATFRTMIR